MDQMSIILFDSFNSTDHLIWIPSYSADSLPAKIVQSQALFFRLDVPDSHKAPTTSGDHNMRHIFIPIKTLEIIGSGNRISHSKWIVDVVQIRDKQLTSR